MHDTLMFLHILSVFGLVAGIVMYSAYVLGAPVDKRGLGIAGVLTAVGGTGVIVFGVWLAIYVKGVEVWDGWVIAALVLFFAAMGISNVPEAALKAGAGDEPRSVEVPSRAALFHWLAVTLVVAILVIMLWRPGA